MTTLQPEKPAPTIAPAVILCVDDEPNILAALARLLGTHGHRVRTAVGARAGLATLEREPVEIVISDMRMPEMDGADFLAEVARRWPETVRILLTGHADLAATVRAINDANIFRYIAKPWDDNDLVHAVARALEFQGLAAERKRLLALTLRQNEELKTFNSSLEQRVAARTEEIRQTAGFLHKANADLRKSYEDTIVAFANLFDLRLGISAGHSRRVADLAVAIAVELGLEKTVTEDVRRAALLHDIGKIGLRDDLLRTPEVALGGPEREELRMHPLLGHTLLRSLAPLQGAVVFIRGHHERYDGGGYPDRLAGEQIPLGARILAVANDYDALQNGTMLGEQLDQDRALAFIVHRRGVRYDPAVVDALLRALKRDLRQVRCVTELRLPPDDLQPGMTLTRDLLGKDGTPLLTKGHTLTQPLIERITELTRAQGKGLAIYVQAELGGQP